MSIAVYRKHYNSPSYTFAMLDVMQDRYLSIAGIQQPGRVAGVTDSIMLMKSASMKMLYAEGVETMRSI